MMTSRAPFPWQTVGVAPWSTLSDEVLRRQRTGAVCILRSRAHQSISM